MGEQWLCRVLTKLGPTPFPVSSRYRDKGLQQKFGLVLDFG